MVNFDLRFMKVVGAVVWLFDTASSLGSNNTCFHGDRITVAGDVLTSAPDVWYLGLLAAVREGASTVSTWAQSVG